MMRKIKHILPLALAVLAFTACSQEETDTLPDSKLPLTLTATIAGGANTRATVDNNWAGGEKIALQVSSTKYYDYTVDRDGIMTGNYYWQDGDNVNIQGFCPSDQIKNNLPCSVEMDQSTDDNFHNSDLLCSNLASVYKNSTYNMLDFYHQTAKVIVNVTNGGYLSGGADNKVSMTINGLYTSATFTKPISMADNMIWAGTWTNHNNQKAITPHTAATTSGNAATFEALVIPQTVNAGTTLFQFNVGEVGPFTYEVPAGGIMWETGMKYTYNVTLKAENQTVTENSISAGGWGNGGSHDLETE